MFETGVLTPTPHGHPVGRDIESRCSSAMSPLDPESKFKQSHVMLLNLGQEKAYPQARVSIPDSVATESGRNRNDERHAHYFKT